MIELLQITHRESAVSEIRPYTCVENQKKIRESASCSLFPFKSDTQSEQKLSSSSLRSVRQRFAMPDVCINTLLISPLPRSALSLLKFNPISLIYRHLSVRARDVRDTSEAASRSFLHRKCRNTKDDRKFNEKIINDLQIISLFFRFHPFDS